MSNYDDQRRTRPSQLLRNKQQNKTCIVCGKPGSPRIDHGLPCGVYCDKCFSDMQTDCRQRSW